jgi:hypothetical protein
VSRALLLAALLASVAQAARPRVDREEFVAVPVAPVEHTSLFTVDLGAGAWESSLTGAGSFELSVGVGKRFNRHVFLLGELSGAITPSPRSGYLLFRFGLSAVLGWNVLALVPTPLPLEAGPELGVGVGYMVGQGFALPLIQAGAFARYTFSPAIALGVRLRAEVPWWFNYSPPEFHGGRTIGGSIEPFAFVATLSLAHTF